MWCCDERIAAYQENTRRLLSCCCLCVEAERPILHSAAYLLTQDSIRGHQAGPSINIPAPRARKNRKIIERIAGVATRQNKVDLAISHEALPV